MQIRAQQIFDLAQLDKVLSLTVDDALALALAHVEDGALQEETYTALLDKLGELEQNAFTMGLATEGIAVVSTRVSLKKRSAGNPGAPAPASLVIRQLGDLAKRQGCIYEDQYRDALYDHDGLTVAAVNNWIMGSMIPLKRNPPRGTPKPRSKGISPDYKKKVLKQLHHPNVKTMTSYRAKLGYSRDEGGYYARVVEAKSGASVAESVQVYPTRKQALRVAASLLANMRQAQQATPSHQQYMKDLDDLVSRIQSATGEADESMAESPSLAQAKDEVKRAIEKFKSELSKMAKRQAAADAAFVADKQELMKVINDWHPENVKDWLARVDKIETVQDLQNVEKAFYEAINQVPSAEDKTKKDHDFTEYVGLPQGEEDEEPLELDEVKK